MKKFKKDSFIVVVSCENQSDIDGLEVNYCYKLDRDSDGDGFSTPKDTCGDSSAWDAGEMGDYELREATEEEIRYYKEDANGAPYDIDDIPIIDLSNRKAYISCPKTESLEILEKVKETLRKVNYEPYHWVRGTKYNRDIIDGCGIFVMMMGDINLDGWMSTFDLTSGVRAEFERARELKKPTYLAYKSSRGWRVYRTKFDANDDTFCTIDGYYLKFTESPIMENYSIF